MITYLVEEKQFVLNYKDLKEQHEKFCAMSDGEFMENLSAVTHLACIIAYLKGLTAEVVLSDTGVIHELVHLWDIPDEPVLSLPEIRQKYNDILKLS